MLREKTHRPTETQREGEVLEVKERELGDTGPHLLWR